MSESERHPGENEIIKPEYGQEGFSNRGVFEGLKNRIHNIKEDADPEYKGQNPKTPQEVIKELQKLGVVENDKQGRRKELEILARKWGFDDEQISKMKNQELEEAVVFQKGISLLFTEKELKKMTPKERKERVAGRELRMQRKIEDLVEAVVDEAEPPLSKEEIRRNLTAAIKNPDIQGYTMDDSEVNLSEVAKRYMKPGEIDKLNNEQFAKVLGMRILRSKYRTQYKAASEMDRTAYESSRVREDRKDLRYREASETAAAKAPKTVKAPETLPEEPKVKYSLGDRRLARELAVKYDMAEDAVDKMSAADFAETLGAKIKESQKQAETYTVTDEDKRKILGVFGPRYGITRKDMEGEPKQWIDSLAAKIRERQAEAMLAPEPEPVPAPGPAKAEPKPEIKAEPAAAAKETRPAKQEAFLRPQDDPEVQSIEKNINSGVLADPEVINSTWDEYVSRNPEKAQAQAKYSLALRRAVDRYKNKNTPDDTMVRRGAEITLARLEKAGLKFEDLNAANEKEGNKKFLEKTRELWKEFAVHGRSGRDPKTGKTVIIEKADLDGRVVPGLLSLAGIDAKDVVYVPQGEFAEGRINFDTGNRDGVVVEGEDERPDGKLYYANRGRTAFVDHHTVDSGHEQSTALITYELLTKMGLLEKYPYLDKMMEFVTNSDNLTFPPEAFGPDSARTMAGLRKNLSFEQLRIFFQRGQDPYAPIPEAELKRIPTGVYWKDGKQVPRTLFDISENRRLALERAEARFAELEQQGFVIETKDYGKIVVDINGSLATGKEYAKYKGAGLYLNWNPNGQGFFLTTLGRPLKHRFDQGIPVRDTMWLKDANDPEPLKIKLADLLSAITNGELEAQGELKNYLDKEIELPAGAVPTPETQPAPAEVVPLPQTPEAELAAAAAGLTPEATEPARPVHETININGRVVDVSRLVEQYADRLANEKVRQLVTEGNFFKRTFYRMGEEMWRIRYRNEALNEIKNNNNLLTLIELRLLGKNKKEVTQGDNEQNLRILDEVIATYEDEIARADEKGELVKDPEIGLGLANLFYRHAKGEFSSRKEFEDAVAASNIYDKLRGKKFTTKEERQKEQFGLMYANNFWNLAESYKDQIGRIIAEHGPENEEAVTAYLNGIMNVDIRLGAAKRDLWSDMPQGKLTRSEQFVNWAESQKYLNKIVANPFMYGLAGAVVGQLGARAAVKAGILTGTAIFFAPTTAALLAGGITSGIFMAARRGRDLKHDRGMDQRRQALGEESGGKRTDQIREKGGYNLMEASDAEARLREIAAKLTPDEGDKRFVANLIARMQMEEKYKVDLISVGLRDSGELGTRRFEMNNLKRSLRDVQGLSGMSEAELASLITEERAGVVKDIEDTNEKFDKFLKREKIKAGVIGGIAGAAAGALAQFGIDQLRGHGLPLMDNQKHSSLIEGLYHVMQGEKPNEVFSGALIDNHLPQGGHMNLPPDYSVVEHAEGGRHFVDIVDDDGSTVADNLEVDPSGKLTPEALEDLRDRGFEVSETMNTGLGDIELGSGGSQVATVAELQQHFSDLGKHARVDWHDELGPRYSNFFNKLIEYEGKQQMQYLEKDPNTGMVYMDVKKVAENLVENAQRLVNDPEFGKNPDGSTDTKLADLVNTWQSWAKDPQEFAKHFQAVIIPTEEANKLGLSTVSTEALVDGHKLPLPKNTWSMFDTDAKLKDGSIPFRFMEQRFEGHVLNTTQGKNFEIPGGGGSTPSERLIPVYDARPMKDPDWIMPLPFWPRKGLEKTLGAGSPYFYYGYQGERLSEEERSKFESRRSVTLRENAGADLDPRKEIRAYLDKQDSKHMEEVRELAGQAGSMNPECRLSICIPVAGHQEGKNIYKTLENYTNQTAPKDSYELVLFVNSPATDKKGDKVKPDSTLDEINRFKKDHPDINLRVIHKVLPINQAKMGDIRKLLTDAVLVRDQERGLDRDHILVSNDADNKGMAPEYVQNFINKFEKHQKTDAMLGQLDWDPAAYVRNPLVHVGTRFFQYVDVQTRRKRQQYPSSGANFAYKSSIYAAVDGYSPQWSLAEDIDLGRRIKAARADSPERSSETTRFAGANVSRLYTSARRAEKSLKEGFAPYEQWSNGFSAFDDEVRKTNWEKLGKNVNFDKPKDVQKFTLALEKVLNRTFRALGEANTPEVRRALGWLGVEYRLSGKTSIKITNADKLIEGLKEYQKSGLGMQERKTGKKPKGRTGRAAASPAQASAPRLNPLAGIGRGAETRPAATANTPELEIRPNTPAGTDIAGTTEIRQGAAPVENPDSIRERIRRSTAAIEAYNKNIGEFTSEKKAELQKKLSAVYADIKNSSDSNSKAQQQFGKVMRSLGFRKTDWKEKQGGEIEVRSIENVKQGSRKERKEKKENKPKAQTPARQPAVTGPPTNSPLAGIR